MAKSFSAIVFLLGWLAAQAAVLSASSGESSRVSTELGLMKEVFFRSYDTHARAISSMTKSMTLTKAMDILKKGNKTSASLLQIASMAGIKRGNLRADPTPAPTVTQPPQYTGLDKAREMLNGLIYEAEKGYDEEIMECTDFYSRKCSALEAGQSDLLASNYLAASARTLMAHATETIERTTREHEDAQDELDHYTEAASKQRKTMDDRLNLVLDDIKVLTLILEMTDCSNSSNVQSGTSLLEFKRCPNGCSHKGHPGTIEFVRPDLQKQVNQLSSKVSRDSFQDTMSDLFDGIQEIQDVEFIQMASSSQKAATMNTTKVELQPQHVPKMGKLGACSDPYKGGPPPGNGDCKLTNGTCYKLQGMFLKIQASAVEEKEALERALTILHDEQVFFNTTQKSKMKALLKTKGEAETDLDEAMRKEATATSEAISTTNLNNALNAEVKKKMSSCRSKYSMFEGEVCALKKIRGELYKMKGDGHNGFFTDCAMGRWVEEQCSAECGGGEQNLTRSIAAAQDGGAKCLAQRLTRSCNNQACPIDCVQEPWQGWSKCSAECGGGVQRRIRRTITASRYGGAECGETKEEAQCNAEACDRDCELSEWTKWDKCSKDCGGGSRKRFRFVKKASTGSGKCASRWSRERLEYTHCNTQQCVTELGYKTKACLHKPVDVVLLIDGSGSVGSKGWDAEKQLTKTFIDAFDTPFGVDAQIAAILYSGPRDWSGWRKCFAKRTPKAEREIACNVRTVSHFTNNLKKLNEDVAKLEWPKGGTLTSLAIKKAQAELVLGRPGRHANVVVITDGRPTAPTWTEEAAFSIRKHARLLWVPVTRALSSRTQRQIRRWATRKWQENVFAVRTFDDLKKQKEALVSNIIAGICPGPERQIEWEEETNKQCAVEGGTCRCNGTVFYGKRFTNGRPGKGRERSLEQLKMEKYEEKAANGVIKCNNGVFGDPTPGYYKQCICKA